VKNPKRLSSTMFFSLVVKRLLPLNKVENIWMRRFALRRDPLLVFPSHNFFYKRCVTFYDETLP
jgi:hypothetical protein